MFYDLFRKREQKRKHSGLRINFNYFMLCGGCTVQHEKMLVQLGECNGCFRRNHSQRFSMCSSWECPDFFF